MVEYTDKAKKKYKAIFTLQNLRQTCCTDMLNRKISPKVVQKIMGHSNLATTMNYYTDASEEAMQEAAKVLQGRHG